MDREKLYELLDIDGAEDFIYFENLASYLECDEELNYEDVANLLVDVDLINLAGVIDNYFEELTDYVPGDQAEVYTILENVRRALVGMARESDDDDIVTKFIDEIERFRQWYSITSKAYISNVSTGVETECCLRDALVNSRLENLGGEKYQYDFSECMSYDLDEYIMSFADMIALSEQEEENNLDMEMDD